MNNEPLTGDALSRRVAEILGWEIHPVEFPKPHRMVGYWNPKTEYHVYEDLYRPDTDENQATAAVKEWCGDDKQRWEVWGVELFELTVKRQHGLGPNVSLIHACYMATASATQKCQALVAAYEALEEK